MNLVTAEHLQYAVALLCRRQLRAYFTAETGLGIAKGLKRKDLLVARVAPYPQFNIGRPPDNGKSRIFKPNPHRTAGDHELLIRRKTYLHLRAFEEFLGLDIQLPLEQGRIGMIRRNCVDEVDRFTGAGVVLLIELKHRPLVANLGLNRSVAMGCHLVEAFAGGVEIAGHPVNSGDLQLGARGAQCTRKLFCHHHAIVLGLGPRIVLSGHGNVPGSQINLRAGFRIEALNRRINPLDQNLGQRIGLVEISPPGVPLHKPYAECKIQAAKFRPGKFGRQDILFPGALQQTGME